jgi:hypothetical protein
MANRRSSLLPALAVTAWALCGPAPALAQGKPPRLEAAQVRVVHCSDIDCSPTEDGGPGQRWLELHAHYPALAGATLRVVVVGDEDKRVSLIDVTADVASTGEFRASLPVGDLPLGAYDIGVLSGNRFLAYGRIQLKPAPQGAPARPAGLRPLQVLAPAATRPGAVLRQG